MATYLILNLVFILVVILVLRVRLKQVDKAVLLTAASLILLTLIFDNIMIAMSFFEYNPGKILGVMIGVAPIEDFMYAVLAAIIVPVIWKKMERVDVK